MIWLLSGLSALCFWIGGRWWGNKLVRRIGCTIALMCFVFQAQGFCLCYWWVYLLIITVSYFLVGTYWDFLGIDHGTWEEETTLSWIGTGFGYGLVAIPLYWLDVSWQNIALRTIILMILIPLIRKIPNVHIQEAGSGFAYLITIITIC